MKHINIHHFPENPFEEEESHRPQQHHHHHRRRPHQSMVHSHFNTMHSAQHHSLTSTFTNRASRINFNAASGLPRVHEELSIPIPDEDEAVESSRASTPTFEEPVTPSVSPRLRVPRSDSISMSNENNRIITNFLTNYLGHDGTLVLYILKINTNEVITGELVTSLFDLFKTNYRIDTTD